MEGKSLLQLLPGQFKWNTPHCISLKRLYNLSDIKVIKTSIPLKLNRFVSSITSREELEQLDIIRRKENVILVGTSGTSNTHLASIQVYDYCRPPENDAGTGHICLICPKNKKTPNNWTS